MKEMPGSIYTLDVFEHVQITGAEIEPEIFTIQNCWNWLTGTPFSHDYSVPICSPPMSSDIAVEMHVLLARLGSGPDLAGSLQYPVS